MTSPPETSLRLLAHMGTRLSLFTGEGKEVASLRLPAGGEDLGRLLAGEGPEHLRVWAAKWLSARPGQALLAADSLSLTLARSVGIGARKPGSALLRRARLGAFSPIPAPALVAMAEAELGERMSSAEQQVISLSQEHDRLERFLRREGEVVGNLSASSLPGTPVEKYLGEAAPANDAMRMRLTSAQRALVGEVTRLLPNTVALLGAKTTGRLLTAAGSLHSLGHMTASRIQLLGARRRSQGKGPRYGLIYLAEGMDAVPAPRKGALARTLASMASLAIRADTTTHADLTAALLAKKERRMTELARAGKGRA